ncbi:hypothetical protein [Synechococcus phage Ssp-JY38]|nr:hypothetical protein [Synechococcus phage Yong-L2-223]
MKNETCKHVHPSSPQAIIERALAADKFVCIGDNGTLSITLEKPKGYKQPTRAQIDALQRAHEAKSAEQAAMRRRAQIVAQAEHRISTAYPVAQQLQLLIASATGDDVSAKLAAMQQFIGATNSYRDTLLGNSDDWQQGWPEPEGE